MIAPDTSPRVRLLAVLAADAVGYSRLMSLDDRGTVTALDAARVVFGKEIADHAGHVVDMAGDSVLAVFENATAAVQAALAIQRRLSEAAASGVLEDLRLRFRIGVHLGDVIEKSDGSIYGNGVNIAARLESLAAPGGVVAAMNARFTRHGLVNVRCQQADMEALPFVDGSFDAVSCRYGLMYARDPARAIAEAARVVRPGGRTAFMVWGPEANNNLLFHGVRAANEFLGKPIEEASFLVPSRFAEPGLVAGLMTAAGMQEALEQDVIVEPKIKVGVPFWAPLLEMNASHIWGGLTPEVQKKVHQSMALAYEPFRNGEHYVFKTHIRLISGLRPLAGD